MLKNILLIADVRGWAFDSIAQYVKSILSDQYDCRIIYTSDYESYEEFLKNLDNYPDIDLIHFFYRGYLAELLENIINKNNINYVKLINSAITTHIPDHLFIQDSKSISHKLTMFDFLDNYYTTSRKLFDIYNNLEEYPRPHSVIYDNLALPEAKPSLEIKDRLNVIWVGNSKWGEWIFGKDYDFKGLKKIIEPTFMLLEKAGIVLNKIIVDSSVQKISRQKVLELYKKSDIVLISSKNEGTPLPLLEAMSNGCAIISTDVGIAKEVLPEIQREFIVKENSEDFAKAIIKLNQDKELLLKIKNGNYDSYIEKFTNADHFKNLWKTFIQDSINNNKSRMLLKQDIIKGLRNNKSNIPRLSLKRFANMVMTSAKLKKIAKILFKYPILHNFLGLTYNTFEHLSNGNSYDNFKSQLENLYNRIKMRKNEGYDSEIYAIYPDRFPGVANSTRKLFSNTLSLSSSGITEYRGLRSSIIDKIANLIVQKNIKIIIMSGGSIAQIQLTKKLHELDAAIKIHYLWHGSPAQWCDRHHHNSFIKWQTLYKEGKIKSILTLKKGLEKFLTSHDIKTALLQNFIPTLPHRIHIRKGEDDPFKIGVWSAYNSWIKNLYPQFMAISMVKGATCHTNFRFDKEDHWIIDTIKLNNFPPVLPHKELLELMIDTDLTLYITNSECSPMIVIESISMNIPCLVGPTSGFYECDEYLKEMLTINRVDCPDAIYAAIERVKNNLEEIKLRLPDFIIKYNKFASDLKNIFCISLK